MQNYTVCLRISQAAKKPNDKKIEDCIGFGIAKFTPGTDQKDSKDSEYVWNILMVAKVDKLNTCYDTLLGLFCNNYLTSGFNKKSLALCYVMFYVSCFVINNQWGALTTNDITFIL